MSAAQSAQRRRRRRIRGRPERDCVCKADTGQVIPMETHAPARKRTGLSASVVATCDATTVITSEDAGGRSQRCYCRCRQPIFSPRTTHAQPIFGALQIELKLTPRVGHHTSSAPIAEVCGVLFNWVRYTATPLIVDSRIRWYSGVVSSSSSSRVRSSESGYEQKRCWVAVAERTDFQNSNAIR